MSKKPQDMSLIMLQYLKKFLRVGQIMRYKVLQFWAKSDTNHPFTLKGDFVEKLTDVNFVYFMYHHNTIMFKKIIKVDHKIQDCIIFGQIGLGHFFGKIDYSYFCQCIVPHHTKIFELKKILRENHEI